MSMALCIITPVAIYMAAESRQYPSGRDTAQKVFLSPGGLVCAQAGIAGIPYDDGGSWDVAGALQKLLATIPWGPFDSEFNSLRAAISQQLEAALQRYSGSIQHPDPSFVLLAAKMTKDGRAYLRRIRLKVTSEQIRPGRWRHRAVMMPDGFVVHGERDKTGVWWDVPPGCEVALRPGLAIPFGEPAKAADLIKGLFVRTADQSDFCAKRIGGPISIAVADQTGARWFYKEPRLH